MKMTENKTYWESKYKIGETGWNIGSISTPIKEYIDQLTNKNIKILIPGAGNAYEAEYLYKRGFKNVNVLDIAKEPLLNLKKRIPHFPDNQLLEEDFFNHNGLYDLIIEQTFFCAINPDLRNLYAQKIHELLKEDGQLVGLLFDFPLTDDGPPFGGSYQEYLDTFTPYFDIKILEKSYNSIKPRADREFFIQFKKKQL
ncbi:MAG TPA: SAM-dependent methyltransferase [Flavobacteriaceae bacterium]|nr:SAM-dependent methyltransferase [Flavobacteriaceae bacterium]